MTSRIAAHKTSFHPDAFDAKFRVTFRVNGTGVLVLGTPQHMVVDKGINHVRKVPRIAPSPAFLSVKGANRPLSRENV